MYQAGRLWCWRYRHGALAALAAVAEVGSAAIVGAVVAGAILGGFGD